MRVSAWAHPLASWLINYLCWISLWPVFIQVPVLTWEAHVISTSLIIASVWMIGNRDVYILKHWRTRMKLTLAHYFNRCWWIILEWRRN